jgi:hypothetical protein
MSVRSLPTRAKCELRLAAPLAPMGIARTDRICLGRGAGRSPGVQTALGIDCGREPARGALTIEFASPARCPVLSPRRHGLTPFRPLCWVRSGRKRARTPSGRSNRDAVHRAGGVTPVEVQQPAPQSKPVAPASRLVAQVAPSVASGLRLRILAAGPACVRLYSYCGRVCADLKARSSSSAGAGIG